MNNRKHIFITCVVIFILSFATAILHLQPSSYTSSAQNKPQDSTTGDAVFKIEDFQVKSISDATAIVNGYYKDGKDYIVLDYVLNDNPEDFIKYCIVFYDSSQLDQANLLVCTTIGTGVANFSGDMFTFKYSAKDGIVFIDTDTVMLSFIEYYDKTVYDFQVSCTHLGDNNVHFTASSKIR